MSDQSTDLVKFDVVTPTALEAQTRGEMVTQSQIAVRHPRSITDAIKQAEEMACIDQDTAAACIYALPRGGKAIKGPSARLAEICAYAWGNLRIAGRVVNVGDKTITAQGVVLDLEKNILYSVEVDRSILDKWGKRYKEDMVTVTGNAAISIAIRNATFKVIPKAVVERIYKAAERVAAGNGRPLSEQRAACLAVFAEIGVDQLRVLKMIERAGIEEITGDDLTLLRGMYTAIKDGEMTIDEAFPKTLDVKSPVFKRNGSDTPAAPPENDPKDVEVVS